MGKIAYYISPDCDCNKVQVGKSLYLWIEKEPRRWHYGILARRPLLVVVLVSIIQYRPMTEKRS